MECQYCGSSNGMPYKDSQLEGFLCLAPECGRFNELNEFNHKDLDIYDSDM